MSTPTLPLPNSTDQTIQQAMDAGTAGAPPAVPGYSSGTLSGGYNTLVGQTGQNTVTVGRSILALNVDPNAKIPGTFSTSGLTNARLQVPGAAFQELQKQSQPLTVTQLLQQFTSWSANQLAQFKQQIYAAGLVSSAKPSATETLIAWQAVVEEAATENRPWQDVLSTAAMSGWNGVTSGRTTADYGLSGNGNSISSGQGGANNTSTTQTTYISYMDPATAQGALSDAMYRLVGRTPTPQEYQAFLQSLYQYQDTENSGKFDETNTDKTGSASTGGTNTVTQQNVIAQRGIGTRGAQFLAGNAAMNNPEYGPYQAATTYFHAFMQALSGPAAGEQQSGPTVTAP